MQIQTASGKPLPQLSHTSHIPTAVWISTQQLAMLFTLITDKKQKPTVKIQPGQPHHKITINEGNTFKHIKEK